VDVRPRRVVVGVGGGLHVEGVGEEVGLGAGAGGVGAAADVTQRPAAAGFIGHEVMVAAPRRRMTNFQ
jgi:hypothetical protein